MGDRTLYKLAAKENQTDILVKDMDDKQGVVTAYANVYNFEDSDGDISMPGSFKRSVNNNWKRIRVLKDHKTDLSLGIPLEADANDTYGLKTRTQFFMHKGYAKDMYFDIKMMVEAENPLNPELSIGYQVVDRDQKDRRKISEYKLMEYSFLTSWASNELSVVTDLKNIKSHYGIMELLTKMYNIPYSDERLKSIEKILQSLSNDPLEDASTRKEDPIDVEQSIKQFFTNYGTGN